MIKFQERSSKNHVIHKVNFMVITKVNLSPYCSAHDEWLIMKLCMYVGYHDANNVSNFGGDPVTQLILFNVLKLFYAVLRARRTIAVTRPLVLRLFLRDHAQAAGVWKTDAVNL